MSRYSGYCPHESDMEKQAREDARYDHKDRDLYERYSWDSCKEVYTREYDRQRDRIEREREEEHQEQERQEENRRAWQRRQDAQFAEQAGLEEEARIDEEHEVTGKMPCGHPSSAWVESRCVVCEGEGEAK